MKGSARELHSANLPELLKSLNCSLAVSTYQAGQLLSIGHFDGNLCFDFCRFQSAMGIARTPTGLALATKNQIWSLSGQRELAALIRPEGRFDIAFLSRSCHVTGPVMAHDISWCDGRLLFINTLCNCIAAIEAPWSFVPVWKPAFIEDFTPGDRCHLNGLALSEDSSAPAYVTMHGATNSEHGWREQKVDGGVLMEVSTGNVVCRGLSMPHSPRLHRGELYVLNSGEGQLLRINRLNGERDVIAELPGYVRGLDLIGNTAVVGLSRIRETAVFGGLPVASRHDLLRCGIALIDLSSGGLQGFCWFETGVEELFAVTTIPGYRCPIVVGPNAQADEKEDSSQTIWAIPPPP
jgi:uncharacterized protein (TIGR03032 family)